MDGEMERLLRRINSKHGSSFVSLKPKQIQAVKLCRQNDVLAVLPTGYGKTIIIQALPYLEEEKESCVIVVNPLNAIIHEQKQRFGERCVIVDDELIQALEKSGKKAKNTNDTALSKTAEPDPTSVQAEKLSQLKLDSAKPPTSPKEIELEKCVQRLKKGDVTFIIGHPEHLLHLSIKKLFMQKALASKISHLVVDESHVIISWGKSDFRPHYMQLGVLRSLLPSIKILALTATAPATAQTEIKDALCMPRASIVWESPDRPNVYLEVKQRMPSTGGKISVQESYEEILDPMLEKLRDEGSNFPKTIVYLPLQWCAHAHHRAVAGVLLDHPQETTIQSEDDNELSCLITQYHAPQTKGMKSRISQAMKNPTSNLRFLLASEAYGMGADAPDVRHIVHIGPPNSIERYVQEIGRCGRDGAPARATLYFNASDIGDNVTHLQDTVREYCKMTTCRREKLLQYFGCSLPTTENRHDCCDNCRAKCCCSLGDHPIQVSQEEKPVVNPEMAECASEMLLRYFADENALVKDTIVPSAVTGLSQNVVKDLSSNITLYTDKEKLKKKFPLIGDHYISNILSILETVRSVFN